MKTIQQAQDLGLGSNEKVALKSLKDSKEWQFTKDLLEAWVLKLNANSLTGMEVEKGSSLEEFTELRAFVQRWRRFVSLVENKNEE